MAAEMIQKNLSDVGVEMRIRTLEWGTLLKEFVDEFSVLFMFEKSASVETSIE